MNKVIQFSELEFDKLIARYCHSLMEGMDIKFNTSMSNNAFRNSNERHILALIKEVKEEFGHELTYDQISLAINTYFASKR